MTPAQFAVAWVLNNRLVTAAIAGPRTEAQWEDYLRGARLPLHRRRRGARRPAGGVRAPLHARLQRPRLSVRALGQASAVLGVIMIGLVLGPV